VTSVDLSKKYLAWGKRNFELNDIDPAEHEFIYGDAFNWLERLRKKDRTFDVVLIDPPTFSRSKESGVFNAEKHYGKLVQAAMPLLKSNSVLFCSSNAAAWPTENFLIEIKTAIQKSNRRIAQEKYFPQPPDFPISREEPAYLKTVWLRLA
jgi:23S rRNA (cytosine1962-C5)-methyltransferase